MVRSLVVDYPDGQFSVVYPVPRAKLSFFQLLDNRLHDRWLRRWDGNTELCLDDFRTRQIVEGMVAIVPSEKRFPLRADPFLEDAGLFEKYFLADINSDPVQPSRLVRLHLYKPCGKHRVRREDEPLTIQDIPFPTSGDSDIDTLANLINGFGFEAGWKLFNEMDAESIDKLIYTAGELARPADDRINEYVGQLFLSSMDDPEYQRSMLEDW